MPQDGSDQGDNDQIVNNPSGNDQSNTAQGAIKQQLSSRIRGRE